MCLLYLNIVYYIEGNVLSIPSLVSNNAPSGSEWSVWYFLVDIGALHGQYTVSKKEFRNTYGIPFIQSLFKKYWRWFRSSSVWVIFGWMNSLDLLLFNVVFYGGVARHMDILVHSRTQHQSEGVPKGNLGWYPTSATRAPYFT